MTTVVSTKMTKADLAAERLEAAIINCELPPGSLFQESELAEMVGLGRTPVREALLRLSSENLVRLSRSGVLVPELNALTMLKLLELREVIERLTLEKALRRLTSQDRQRFEAIRTALQALSAQDRSGFMEQLREIHRAIAEASKNEFVQYTLKATQGLSRRFWRYFASDDDQRFCIELYLTLMDALIDGDQQIALKQSAALIGYLRDFTSRQMADLS